VCVREFTKVPVLYSRSASNQDPAAPPARPWRCELLRWAGAAAALTAL